MSAGLGGHDGVIEAIGIIEDPRGRAARGDAVVSAGRLRNRMPALDTRMGANVDRIGGERERLSVTCGTRHWTRGERGSNYRGRRLRALRAATGRSRPSGSERIRAVAWRRPQRDAVISAGRMRNLKPAPHAPMWADAERIGGMKRARRARGTTSTEWPRSA
ncbi:hypothetical protein NDU88_004413 [Pleurodeles waltl]|uniref:Uncharacterized protein n=1 Tax=Pleurodeles waltl TaxID=8319 RepID=A0AAV7MTE3_PLEWA|nr:hypothetical protein NDU88_004413 [Pleurodeles waltl]